MVQRFQVETDEDASRAGELRNQAAATGAELNDKFRHEQGTFELAFGSLDTFYGGLEAMLGPPLLVKDSPKAKPSLQTAMKQEHTACADSSLEFTSTNGVTTTSAIEWEVVVAPKPGQDYPDRAGFDPTDSRRRALHLVPIEELEKEMQKRNLELKAINQTLMVVEELLAARLYETVAMIAMIASP